MGFYRISWILLLALCHIISSIAYGNTNLNHTPSAMIVGTVYCDTCFHQNSSRNNQLISGLSSWNFQSPSTMIACLNDLHQDNVKSFISYTGASVMVDCGNQTTKGNFRKAVKTDKDGVFRVQLPSEIGKHIKKIKECSVMLISSNDPFCAVAASANSSSLNLKLTKNKVHVFSSGFFTFRPLNQPEICYQRPSVEGSSNLDVSEDISLSSPLPSLNIPPLPQLPALPTLPNLPPLPNLPNLPLLPPPASPSNPIFPGIPKQLPTKETKP